MTKKGAFKFIVDNPKGDIEVLKSIIGRDLVSEFRETGYLILGSIIYKTSKIAKEDYDAFYRYTPWYLSLPSLIFSCLSKL